MSSEDLECDLPSWSCQTGPQPGPRPLTGKLRRTTGHGVLGRVAPRSPLEVSRARSQMLLPEPEALVSACVDELPAPTARREGLAARWLTHPPSLPKQARATPP